MKNPRWGYVRIITGTIGGGMLGFYLMHRAELKYQEMWKERLKKYEEEMNKRKSEESSSNELQESLYIGLNCVFHRKFTPKVDKKP